ncbi:MAG: bifunctional oligoribonuclease/PAP phosphatase NrnA [Paludibacteraceae bacterium]|jgi:phosphoesterase RecJ-like protein|nr:bifunctional oligoribonuclease/PAP phosphatase NrnA [Paludibacteraceae bacterium]HOI26820.1 bifunctional oligoribonuclease/PAP phosphatase NrnA [Paludibacteraceae bacterium]HOU68624.1 bifunctional oligoribonuclease/PAP phosphatase NrnA [Paludibacteraceae bacterium]HPH63404.1 bifunctional oligoribonuclease/PAP phosphatase NrnA [Paludibacteraceae bacterium]HQF50444.1 bifunctional oligoribonuclease/PAP phosphatase NrnA [Paludibacteraceae bacterium]
MITKIIDEEKIQQAKKEILNNDNIVIVTHVSPDGDALGASLGLYQFLQILEKKVTVIVPNAYPDFLKWMAGSDQILVYPEKKIQADKAINEAELIFALDFNTLSRIGEMGTVVADSKAHVVLIDHHLDPGGFADVVISYPKMSSTSEMIFRLICRMGYFTEMTKECAECIYVGMMTDTGAFSYNSNSSEIYSIISELIRKGIDKDEIYRKVYNNYSADRFRLMGYILSENMKIYPDCGTALLTLSSAELKRYNFRKGDTEGFVNIPLSIKGIIFSVFIKEDTDKVKISLRSQGRFPTNEFSAKVFGGGGHLNASGGESYVSLDETIKKFEAALPEYKELLQKELESNETNK